MPAVHVKGYMLAPISDVPAIIRQIPEHIRLTRAEKGCELFSLLQDQDDPCKFWVEERFSSTDAFAFHQNRIKQTLWGAITENCSRFYKIS